MSLVGSIIMDLRRRIPDVPNVLSSPVLVSLTGATGGILTASETYYVVVTVTNAWGETLASSEENVSLSGSQNSIVASISAPNGAVGVNAYIGSSAGAENSRIALVAQPGTTANYTIGATGQTIAGAFPPLRNSAFLPDTDGSFLSAQSAYDLLTRALDEMVRISGGITDVIGIQAQEGQQMFRITAPNASAFMNFTNVWFDGYP